MLPDVMEAVVSLSDGEFMLLPDGNETSLLTALAEEIIRIRGLASKGKGISPVCGIKKFFTTRDGVSIAL